MMPDIQAAGRFSRQSSAVSKVTADLQTNKDSDPSSPRTRPSALKPMRLTQANATERSETKDGDVSADSKDLMLLLGRPGAEKEGTAESTTIKDTSTAAATSATSTASERIDCALHTLKSELTAMREQDLELLKQLIHINDNIRRLKRARWLQKAGRTPSCGLLGAGRSPTSPVPPTGTPHSLGSGPKDRSSLLLRQRSEPRLLGFPFRRVSTVTSTSSFETINDEDEDEEVDSLYGSATDLQDSTPPTSPSNPPTPTTPSSSSRRPPATYTSLTFTQEELWRGESSYREILKRNVRLWKWSIARERESGIVDGHQCVL